MHPRVAPVAQRLRNCARMTVVDLERIKAMLAQKRSVAEVVRDTGVSKSSVYQIRGEAPAASKWEEHRAALKDMWEDGLSNGEIASRLTARGFAVSRNAVIGQTTRLVAKGVLKAREPGTRMLSRSPDQKRAARARRLKEEGRSLAAAKQQAMARLFTDSEPLPDVPEPEIPVHERKTILIKDAFGNSHANDALDSKSCRWPIGDPQHPDFHFCGKQKMLGLSYCEGHARRAFDPPQVRRRRAAVPKEPPVPTFADSEKEAV